MWPGYVAQAPLWGGGGGSYVCRFVFPGVRTGVRFQSYPHNTMAPHHCQAFSYNYNCSDMDIGSGISRCYPIPCIFCSISLSSRTPCSTRGCLFAVAHGILKAMPTSGAMFVYYLLFFILWYASINSIQAVIVSYGSRQHSHFLRRLENVKGSRVGEGCRGFNWVCNGWRGSQEKEVLV